MKKIFLNHQNNTFKNLNKMDVDTFLSINNIVTDMMANDSFAHKHTKTKTQVGSTKFSRSTQNSYLTHYF